RLRCSSTKRSEITPAASAAALGAPAAAAEELEAFLAPLDSLISEHPALTARTPPWAHLPGLRCFTVEGGRGEALVFLLDREGVAVSTGPACTAGVAGPSRVLTAMGLGAEEALGSVRVSLGHASTAADVEALVRALPQAVEAAQEAALVKARPRHARDE
ncbi:MAG: aminotransferase class V-fold PLP-dependent enzyme, partial [Bifidobacteriaceae bacterium]|nr:aminotransferase class V-fold PLP-dependent enzyme [Bifidobacteriaceae bacterium]